MDSRASTVDRLTTISITEPQIGPDERAAVDRVLRTPSLTQGAEVAAFEAEFSTYLGGKPCVAVNSGTSTLHLGLLAAGAGPGDEVILPSFTAPATAHAVTMTGATPVFADIDRATFCIDPKAVESLITPRTMGIVPVHLFGQVADMAEIRAIAGAYGLAVVEDACHAPGARFEGGAAGTFGVTAAFSFHQAMPIAAGEGGMVVCADDAVQARARQLRTTRMSDLAAAVGRVQLNRLPGFNRVRRMNAAILDDGLRGVETPTVRPHATPVFHQYAVRCIARDRLAAHLARLGIATAVPYSTPVHRLPAYSVRAELPESGWAAAEVLTLPVHPGVSGADVARIVRAVNDATSAWQLAS